MADTRPRDLTAEELAGLESGSVGAQTSPLPVPPGTSAPVESMSTTVAGTTPATIPSTGPNQATGIGSGARPTSGPRRKT